MTLKVEYLKTAELIPYANNSRTHSDEQTAQIASSIREFGFTNPILIDDDGGIIAGHGRLKAATLLKMETVPCIRLVGLSKAQKKAYVIADNKLALNAGWDSSLLTLELQELKSLDFDLALTGFEGDELEALLTSSGSNGDDDGESPYTGKIEAPIYEPKGERPREPELVDNEKRDDLIAEIKAAIVPDEVRDFLYQAATRHSIFNYQKVAEYYAHAPKEVQHLMERSALVIIDFDKAIENGFVQMSNELAKLSGGEYDE